MHDDLKPFEKQSLDIAKDSLRLSRRTYWLAIVGSLSALAAAVLFGVQVSEMSYQTQIMGAQSESAVAGAANDKLNTSTTVL
jgi:hypothetical protein